MADPLVRQDIWRLEQDDPWDPVTLAYAVAVREMQTRPADDPTSWTYQAAVHSIPGVPPDQFRDQCQHNSWFFLPWHRMYLYWFEQIIRSIVSRSPEVEPDVRDTWALPYWNYDRGEDSRRLPPAFRETMMPDGSDNPLFIPQRNDYVNDGDPLPELITSAARSLRVVPFSLPIRPGRTAGFGGFITKWHHFDELTRTPGALEGTPHNGVHDEVGGFGGFMSGFDTAPLDPVFWLHHCNIDRLWEVWLASGEPGHVNPSDDPRWTDLPFYFHDAQGSPVTNTSGRVVDTAADLGYIYDDLSAPTPRRRRGAVATEPPADEPLELVGATEEGLQLTGQTETVAVPLAEPTGPLRRRGEAAEPSRVYLNVENIEAERNPGLTYGVYLNAPDDDPTNEAYHVGNVAFFGIERVSDVDREGGHGLRYAFDVTDLVEQLREEGRWHPEEVKVTLSPLRPPSPRRRGEEARPPVSIGRISVFFE
jgi:tyrosinase